MVEREKVEAENNTQELRQLPSSPSPPYEVLGSRKFGQELDSQSNMVNEMDGIVVHEIGEAMPHELDVPSGITDSGQDSKHWQHI